MYWMQQSLNALRHAPLRKSGRLRHARSDRVVHAAILTVCLVLGPNAFVEADSSAWIAHVIPDPTHRGGSISNARTTLKLHGGASLDAWVRCWTATDLIDTRFILRDYPKPLSGAVSWQFDRLPVQVGSWRVSWSGDSVVVPNALQKQFLQLMRARRTLRLKLDDTGHEQIDVVLSLAGSSRPLERVTDACERSLSGR